MYADGGVTPGHSEDLTRLYFPADQHQFAACVKKIYYDEGLRFIFSTRAPVPDLLDEAGQLFYKDKPFVSGKDDIVRDADGGGYVVSFGEVVYRALDAVTRLKEQGVKVGLINKTTLNVYDEDMMKKLVAAPFVLVAEGWNVKTGLGSRFGTQLLKRGFKGKYNNVGVHQEGSGGLWQQIGFQGLDPAGIEKAIRALV
jgi:transketolase C-terminal domain/subunit